MEISGWTIVGVVVGLTSLVLNLFQYYKKRVEVKSTDKERELYLTTLENLFNNLNNGQKYLREFETKKVSSSIIISNVRNQFESLKSDISGYFKFYKAKSLIRTTSSFQELVEGVDEITNAMISVIESTENYIFTIGGKSRNAKYLNAIKKVIKIKNVKYIRIITGDYIYKQLFNHIEEVWDKLEQGYLNDDFYGGIIATDDTVFVALHSSSLSSLDKGLLIKNAKIASDYRLYIQELYTTSEKGKDIDFYKSMCKNC